MRIDKVKEPNKVKVTVEMSKKDYDLLCGNRIQTYEGTVYPYDIWKILLRNRNQENTELYLKTLKKLTEAFYIYND